MSEPSSENKSRSASGRSPGPTDWERRAADLANEVQRWLIRQSARNMRDEFGDQMKKALRGPAPSQPSDVWETATTEPPDAASQPPECAWCPICRAARRMAQAQISGQTGSSAKPGSGAGPGAAMTTTLAGATDAIVGAARDALTGLDAILSYRPGDLSTPKPTPEADSDSGPAGAEANEAAGPAAETESEPDASSQAGEHTHEPDHRS
jgi:hypothetical protein